MMNGGDSNNFESGQEFSQRDRFQSRRGESSCSLDCDCMKILIGLARVDKHLFS